MVKMDEDLLRKEQHFRKLNNELERKTSELMKEVENVMKFQERISRNSSSQAIVKSNFTARSRRSRSLGKIKDPDDVSIGKQKSNLSVNSKSSVRLKQNCEDEVVEIDPGSGDGEDVLPGGAKALGADATVRFLKAKVKVLQEEFDGLNADYKKRGEECSKLQTEVRSLEEEKRKSIAETTKLQEKVKKQEQALSIVEKKLTQFDAENTSLKKEVETLKRELKQVNQSSAGYEARVNRLLEESERLRATLKVTQQENKESQDLDRQKIEQLVLANKKLQKQKSEILQTFKKVLELLDVLRREKIHIEAAGLLGLTEEQFCKLLNMKHLERRK